jgi:hypothetical protein
MHVRIVIDHATVCAQTPQLFLMIIDSYTVGYCVVARAVCDSHRSLASALTARRCRPSSTRARYVCVCARVSLCVRACVTCVQCAPLVVGACDSQEFAADTSRRTITCNPYDALSADLAAQLRQVSVLVRTRAHVNVCTRIATYADCSTTWRAAAAAARARVHQRQRRVVVGGGVQCPVHTRHRAAADRHHIAVCRLRRSVHCEVEATVSDDATECAIDDRSLSQAK